MHVPPNAVVPRRRVGGLGLASAIVVGIVVALDIASTWTTWNAYGLVRDYVDGAAGVTMDDLNSADKITSAVAGLYLVGLVASGIVFVVWLWQARTNAERLCPAPHRRSRGWIIGSWICPVVNLWFPFMIVDDVYRASRPTNSPDLYDLRSVPGGRVLGFWWTLWLGGLVLDRIFAVTWKNADSVESLRSAAVVETVQTAVVVGAAVTLILIVRRISAWQDGSAR
jgi:hypothetical protein